MVENQTESRELLSVQGTAWKGSPDSGVSGDVQEALDTDLDAYLDRELFAQPAPEVTPTRVTEKPAECLQGVLALAEEEEQWLRALPAPEQSVENSLDLEGGECPIPEHLRAKPASEVSAGLLAEVPRLESPWIPPPAPLPGLTVAPHLMPPGWNLPVAPAAPERRKLLPWLATGALVGVSAAGVFAAGMLWMARTSLPDRTQAAPSPVPASTVAVAAPPPAAPALPVKDAPLPRQPEPLPVEGSATKNAVEPTEPKANPATEAVAHAVQEVVKAPAAVEGASPSVPRNPEPVLASGRKQIPRSREAVLAARKAPAVEERRDVEDPALEDTEEETPLVEEPASERAPARVAEATPPAPRNNSGYEELDEDFARELGFTPDSTPKVPESKGVKSVWIPPDPGEAIAERLTPADIQKVVVANQPAIASCVRRHKEALPQQAGGRFVMRWFVHPSGSTYQIAVETDAFKGTALATCIEGLVRGWKFPRHRVQQGPVRFPFTF